MGRQTLPEWWVEFIWQKIMLYPAEPGISKCHHFAALAPQGSPKTSSLCQIPAGFAMNQNKEPFSGMFAWRIRI